MRKLLTAVLAVLCTAGLPATAPAAHAATTTACTGTLQITSFTFNPPQVTPGHGSTATVVAANCTDQPVTASLMYIGRFHGPVEGIPAGCPIIDPLPPAQITFAPHGTYTGTSGYSAFTGCTATTLDASARFYDATGTLAAANATLLITQTPACSVSYRTSSEWAGGFVAQLTVTNNATTTVNGWALGFTFPGDQHITGAWNTTTTQTGAAVTARNAGYNATLPAGASASFGFIGTWHTSDASPATFTLNGSPCRTT